MESQMKDFVQRQLLRTQRTIETAAVSYDMHSILIAAAKLTSTAMLNSGKLLVAGNGGSAADAQHLVAEFVSRLTQDRPAMRAVALTTDTSILTAVANDNGYSHVFERQIEAIGLPGDVFLGISTSGRSRNVLLGLAKAKEMGLTTVGLCGSNAEAMQPWCDFLISVPSSVTQNIQECHLALEHIYCGLVEWCYLGKDFPA
jgi:D-sedoheptulose 7-phosphate isomerase